MVVGAFVCIAAIALAAPSPPPDTGPVAGPVFRHHGAITPVAVTRGAHALTVPGPATAAGRHLVVAWLMDHRGGYGLAVIDTDTGDVDELPVPFSTGGDAPFASLLSSQGRVYSLYGRHFVEFDPATRTFFHASALTYRAAMALTEDAAGVIWAVTWPDSGVVSFNPTTRHFKVHGRVHREAWPQYQRSLVRDDDDGWLYFSVGNALGQIVAFQPATGESRGVLPEAERLPGSPVVRRGPDGRVYGANLDGLRSPQGWFLLQGGARGAPAGRVIPAGRLTGRQRAAGDQNIIHRDFGDGRVLTTLDTVAGVVVVEDAGAATSHRFTLTAQGGHVLGAVAGPDGSVVGGTAFPMRAFRFDPRHGTTTHAASPGQCNTFAVQRGAVFVGLYGGGGLWRWDLETPWADPTAPAPTLAFQATPTIHRPHDTLALPDQRTVVLGGTPAYGQTGGGLAVYDVDSGVHRLWTHEALLRDQAPMSLTALNDHVIAVGTTVAAGTGGERLATEAELFLFDVTTGEVPWHAPVITGASAYTDLHTTAAGIVYGVVDEHVFFAFDPTTKTLLRSVDLTDETVDLGRSVGGQGPRVFVADDDGRVWLLLRRGIARVDTVTHAPQLWAEAPIDIAVGGAVVDGWLYFGSGAGLHSVELPRP